MGKFAVIMINCVPQWPPEGVASIPTRTSCHLFVILIFATAEKFNSKPSKVHQFVKGCKWLNIPVRQPLSDPSLV